MKSVRSSTITWLGCECGAWAQKRQQEMDSVGSVRCFQCRMEGSEYHRLYECEARTRRRLKLPRGISTHQQQTLTSNGRMVWGQDPQSHSEAVRKERRSVGRYGAST